MRVCQRADVRRLTLHQHNPNQDLQLVHVAPKKQVRQGKMRTNLEAALERLHDHHQSHRRDHPANCWFQMTLPCSSVSYGMILYNQARLNRLNICSPRSTIHENRNVFIASHHRLHWGIRRLSNTYIRRPICTITLYFSNL